MSVRQTDFMSDVVIVVPPHTFPTVISYVVRQELVMRDWKRNLLHTTLNQVVTNLQYACMLGKLLKLQLQSALHMS